MTLTDHYLRVLSPIFYHICSENFRVEISAHLHIGSRDKCPLCFYLCTVSSFFVAGKQMVIYLLIGSMLGLKGRESKELRSQSVCKRITLIASKL